MGNSADSYIGCGFQVTEEQTKHFEDSAESRMSRGASTVPPLPPSSTEDYLYWWRSTEQYSLGVRIVPHGDDGYRQSVTLYVFDAATLLHQDWDGTGKQLSSEQLAALSSSMDKMVKLAEQFGIPGPVGIFWAVNYG